MRITYIGKFERMHDEEYIAQGFENIGNEVLRLDQGMDMEEMIEKIKGFKPDLVLWAKLHVRDPQGFVNWCKKQKYKTACWVFDLYWGYNREYQLKTPAFQAQYVFTTDGGHEKEWKEAGINHHCVRQGIRSEECFMVEPHKPSGAVFVGTHNPYYSYRQEMIAAVRKITRSFTWIGENDDQEMRGTKLNELYGKAKLVIGDSVYSPYYWSNRVVETLGRGGFLVHPDVEGLKEEYPFIITYKRGDWAHLGAILKRFMDLDEEARLRIRKENFEWVKEHYTVEKKCAELLSYL